MGKIGVLFVCYGNICRSPMAEFVFRRILDEEDLEDRFYVASAATSGEHIGDPVDRRAADELRMHGISCEGKRGRRLKRSDFTDYDYIVGMDARNMEYIRWMAPAEPTCEISMLMAYEITRDLPTEPVEIETPICKTTGRKVLGKKLAIVPILRAGLGMVDGFLSIVPVAKVGHIGLYRDPETHQPVEYYFKMPPDISERTVILLDPMLATGGSAISAVRYLREQGVSGTLKVMVIVAAPQGIEALLAADGDLVIYTCSVDDGLNDDAYIVPGLGDAGDRIFGTK